MNSEVSALEVVADVLWLDGDDGRPSSWLGDAGMTPVECKEGVILQAQLLKERRGDPG